MTEEVSLDARIFTEDIRSIINFISPKLVETKKTIKQIKRT